MRKKEFHTSDSEQKQESATEEATIGADERSAAIRAARFRYRFESPSRPPPWYFEFRVKLHVAQSNI